ncbi:MAG: hypothetical protein JWM98_415 [Thermoleophilia bacterium]|nr:hypothetical protein [Thermoleophilia bacterium]
MRADVRHRGAAARRRGLTALVLCVAAPLAFGGCHDEARLRQRLEGPPARLPVEPDQPSTPPAPALLDTVLAWQQPKDYPAATIGSWALVPISAGNDTDLTYRVPQQWTFDEDGGGHATNLHSAVDAQARVTQLDDEDISLASYAAQLAEGNPIQQYTTTDGHVVYLTRREVALAPSDPDAPREVFHTAVVSIDGHIAKLDVRYDTNVDWRFDELATAISGTLQVRRTAS